MWGKGWAPFGVCLHGAQSAWHTEDLGDVGGRGRRRMGPKMRRKGTGVAGASTVGPAPLQGQSRNGKRQKRTRDRAGKGGPFLSEEPLSHRLGSSEAQRLGGRAEGWGDEGTAGCRAEGGGWPLLEEKVTPNLPSLRPIKTPPRPPPHSHSHS